MGFPLERIRIGLSPITNTILVGRVNSKKTEWLDRRDCTEEALAVVRDHLCGLIEEGKSWFGYEWTRKDGKIVSMYVKVSDAEEENEEELS